MDLLKEVYNIVYKTKFPLFTETPPPPVPKQPPPKIVKAVTEETQTEVPLPPEPDVIDYRSLELVMTELYRQDKDTFLTYSNVPWTLHVRKEVHTLIRLIIACLFFVSLALLCPPPSKKTSVRTQVLLFLS